MSKTLKKFISEFPTTEYSAVNEKIEKKGGAWLESPSISPTAAFELLEVIYGEYKDLNQEYLFIDNKSTWERYFKTPNGILTVYDFKGKCSIGYSGSVNNELRSDAKKFNIILNEYWAKYLLIKNKVTKEIIKKEPLGNFMRTFFAVSELIENAKNGNNFIEVLILYASQVDAMLRLGIILKIQILKGVETYDEGLIFQKGKSFKTERVIFKEAHDIGFIKKTDYNQLMKLYDFRNRVVHRYFISDFEYSEISAYLIKYEKIIEKLGDKLGKLENEQVKKGIGMTKSEHLSLDDKKIRSILREKNMKIDSSKYVTVIPKRKVIFPEEDY
jgi:hypothetical protein